jgi:hypothetical protein
MERGLERKESIGKNGKLNRMIWDSLKPFLSSTFSI